ncbi:MAG: MATE family efflux transporter [[Bacteroides] pectinophilus]|nr:MATE family efflux transporter [[Bacteroides] pectinophilus]
MSMSINQHFTPAKLIRFAAPSIIMMIFMSLYTIVDGIFISRFIGSNALSSLNIVFPVINIAIAISTMLATGGNAIISKYLGEGRRREASECLTMFVVVTVSASIIIMILTFAFLTPISRLLGATDILLEDCRSYLATEIAFAPACMLQALFQSYLVTAGLPALGLGLTVIAGILNAVLDYVFIGKTIHFTRFRWRIKELLAACYNGSSEMVTQLSNAVVTFLFNIVMMRLAGENGVAAITILLYGQYLFNAFYLGFTIGISPVIGFQFGAKRKKELKNIYKVSFIFVMCSSLILTLAAIRLSTPIVSVFTHDAATFALASSGFRIFAFNFLFSGFNIASSGFFTALSNGRVSAVISFARTLVFTVVSLLVLPQIIGINGAWTAIPAAEFLTLILSAGMHLKYFVRNNKYNYFE